MTLADRMAVFMAGEIDQIGTPSEVCAPPNSLDVAAFIGSPPMNLIPARLAGGNITIAGQSLPAARPEMGDRDVIVGIRPGAVRIVPAGIPAKVDLVEDLGDTAVLDLDCAGTRVRSRVNHDDLPAENASVFITARPQDIHLFDPDTRKRL
jgi:ABC-type sugar transport system ATPase subunit